MSEFLTIQIGQCGNQIGSCFWPLALQEYGIDLNFSGAAKRAGTDEASSASPSIPHPDALHSFFWSPKEDGKDCKTLADMEEHKLKARVICIDMEDSVVARYRSGPLKRLFDSQCLITSYPGSGNNWAEGHYTHGLGYRSKIVDMIRQSVERCDSLHGFLLLFSLGGGTGSGLGTATLGFLAEEFPSIERFVTCVYPAETDDVIISPYNVALATRELSEHASCVFPVDNGALTNISTHLKKVSRAPKKPTTDRGKEFSDMNGIIVDMLLHLTSGSRFGGDLNVDMNELVTNMVPYPKLHYISSGVSPYSRDEETWSKNMRTEAIFNSAWSQDHQLLNVDPFGGLIIGATFLARGNMTMTDVRRNVERFEAKAKFLPWNKNAVRAGLCSVPPYGVDASLLSLINTTHVRELFEGLIEKFDKLYRVKAHTHHYLKVDGCDLSTFEDSRASLIDTVQQYRDLELCPPVDDPRLSPL